MFDEHTEEICEQLGLRVAFPPAELRKRMDNKIETVRIGNKAGVPSVPNVLARVGSYQELLEVSESLGNDLVVQTAFGDSVIPPSLLPVKKTITSMLKRSKPNPRSRS